VKIFIESLCYENALIPKSLESYFVRNEDGAFKTDFVGYYNDFAEAPVLILPKIFSTFELSSNFWKDCAEIGCRQAFQRSPPLDNKFEKFLSRFVFLFFLSLKKFANISKDSSVVVKSNLGLINRDTKKDQSTELEVVMSLLDFNKKYKDILMLRNLYDEQGNPSQIDWGKTIREKLPLIFDDNIIYPSYISNDVIVDNSESLLVLYYSLLESLKETYSISCWLDPAVQRVSVRKILNFDRKSLRFLKKIKGQYFDDRFKRLYKLLKAYFDLKEKTFSSKTQAEYLFVSSYHIVFENMVDDLLSSGEDFHNLKNQDDGKRVDHLFEFESLFEGENSYYIGDSKYYKESTSLSRYSVSKQFTYAKNINQYNVDIFNQGLVSRIRQRDPATEGYNICPNFFIQAYVHDLNLESPVVSFNLDHEKKTIENFHFSNRVFDRDTFSLLSFKINFLFLLKQYVTFRTEDKKTSRMQCYEIIRMQVLTYYNEQYTFYQFTPAGRIDLFIDNNFKLLNGKIFQPANLEKTNIMLVGLSKNEVNAISNKEIVDLLGSSGTLVSFLLK
jgi:hypothetical protein